MGRSEEEEEEKVLRKELKKEIKKRQGWESLGLHCPKCKSMDMQYKTVRIIGYLYMETPDTLVRCFNCGYTAAYRGMNMVMQLE